jgi:EipB-like
VIVVPLTPTLQIPIMLSALARIRQRSTPQIRPDARAINREYCRKERDLNRLSGFAAIFIIGLASPASANKLTPHRAVYDLELLQSKGDQSVGEARGRIAFEFTGNACEGYVLNFRQVLQIDDQDNGARLFDTRNSTWEDGAARSFRFDSERRVNNAVTESGKGRAERSEQGDLSIQITRPQRKNSDHAGPVLFPTQQLIAILEAARAGKGVFESRVFDGSDGTEKTYETTAILGKAIEDGGKGLDESLQGKGFEAMKRWPITISYFEEGVGERTPLSVISYDLLDNGVMNKMRIDFGEFVMSGRPSRFEPLADEPCEK